MRVFFNEDDCPPVCGVQPVHVIRFCRKVFGRAYSNFWIYPVYYEGAYEKFDCFREVGIYLLPRIGEVPDRKKWLKARGCDVKKRDDPGWTNYMWYLAKSDRDTNMHFGVEKVNVVIRAQKTVRNEKVIVKRVREVPELPKSAEDKNVNISEEMRKKPAFYTPHSNSPLSFGRRYG